MLTKGGLMHFVVSILPRGKGRSVKEAIRAANPVLAEMWANHAIRKAGRRVSEFRVNVVRGF